MKILTEEWNFVNLLSRYAEMISQITVFFDETSFELYANDDTWTLLTHLEKYFTERSFIIIKFWKDLDVIYKNIE